MDFLISLPLMLVAIVIHEAWGHKLFSKALTSLAPTMIAIGVPIKLVTNARDFDTIFGVLTLPAIYIDTTWKVFARKNDIPIVVSWLLIGGGVGFDDKQYYSVGRFFEKILMLVAGPLVNISFALWLLLFFSDWHTTIVVFKSYIMMSSDLVWAIFSSTTIAEAIKSQHFYEATFLLARQTVWWQVVAYSALWNISLAITNLLPIPGLDGGQIVSTILINLFGEKIVPTVKQVNTVFAYALILLSSIAMVWWVVSSLVGLISTLG